MKKYVNLGFALVCGIAAFTIFPEYVRNTIWGLGFLVAGVAFLYDGLKGK